MVNGGLEPISGLSPDSNDALYSKCCISPDEHQQENTLHGSHQRVNVIDILMESRTC